MAELALILGVAAFSFWVKAIAGFGGPLLGVPLLAPFLGVEGAVVVLALANLVSNLMLLWSNRHAGRRVSVFLVRLIPAGAAGVVGGTILLTRLDDAILSLALAATVLAYIVITLARPELSMSEERGRAMAAPVGAVGGLVHGATGNSGAIFGSFYHALKLPRDDYVLALTVTFLGFGAMQIVTFVGLGSFGSTRLWQAVLAIIPIVIVTPLGERMARRLNPATFRWIVLGLLAFAAIVLVVGAFA